MPGDDLKCRLLGLNPSFGFGDRTGLATPGHVAAMKAAGAGIAPIFPQQSIREMTRTNRTPAEVMRDAMTAARASGWSGPIGADADHLKTREDVDVTAAAGFTFFTIDPSGYVDQQADRDSVETLEQKLRAIAGEVGWIDAYRNKSLSLDTGTRFTLDDAACLRAAVKYGRAINHAIELASHIEQTAARLGQPFEIELSVDETDFPTSPAEHYLIAHRCLEQGMRLVSLAPRFIGDFEKGVDFKGNLADLQKSLDDHAAIARLVGPYKLSLHSGSDKLSVYGMLARSTRGLFHVKTAGTTYLEALRVVARCDEGLFRDITTFSRSRYDTDKATYHVSATLASAPPPTQVPGIRDLERMYLELWDDVPAGCGFTALGRQILHCTFGSVLTHAEFGPAIRNVLKANPGVFSEILCDHFSRHLRALCEGI